MKALSSRLVVLVASVSLFFAATGCATVFKSKTTPVTLGASFPGSEVLVDGVSAGKAPVTLALSNKTDHTVTYRTESGEKGCTIHSKASMGWIVADIFLTVLVGLIVDVATKNANNLEPQGC